MRQLALPSSPGRSVIVALLHSRQASRESEMAPVPAPSSRQCGSCEPLGKLRSRSTPLDVKYCIRYRVLRYCTHTVGCGLPHAYGTGC